MGTSPYPCCIEGCVIASDGFDRPNSDNPGGNWEEVSGNWRIHSNTLKEDGNSGACILHKFMPYPDPAMVVVVKTVNEQAGNKYRVLVNYQDANNYHYAEFSIGTPSTVAIYKAGDPTPLDSVEVALSGNSRLFIVCFGDNQFSANVTEACCFVAWAEATPFPNGFRTGLGNGAAQPIQFDDFTLGYHAVTDPDCRFCTCHCEHNVFSKTLTVTATGTGRCECATGASCQITYNRVEVGWLGDIHICGVGSISLRFICLSDYLPEDMRLCIFNCWVSDEQCKSGTGTCSPLSLSFTWYVAGGDLTCPCIPSSSSSGSSYSVPPFGPGTLTLTVTE